MKRVFAFVLAVFIILSANSLFSCGDGRTSDDQDGTEGVDTKTSEDADVPAGKVFYVSAEGSDDNEGSEDHPLLSLNGARKAVLEFRKSSGLPEGGIEVIFEPGTYMVDSQTVFTADDSGDTYRPVVYRAKEKGSVVFDGGVRIDPSLFVPASDEVKAKLIDESARSSLLEVDLNAAGCYDLDDSTEYDIGWECRSYRQELYVDNQRQTVARWPNADYEAATILCQNGEIPYVTIPEDKAVLWKNEPDIRYFGYPVYDWDAVNLGSGAVRIDEKRSVYEIL